MVLRGSWCWVVVVREGRSCAAAAGDVASEDGDGTQFLLSSVAVYAMEKNPGAIRCRSEGVEMRCDKAQPREMAAKDPSKGRLALIAAQAARAQVLSTSPAGCPEGGPVVGGGEAMRLNAVVTSLWGEGPPLSRSSSRYQQLVV